MTTSTSYVDPRVKRTRQLLQNAFLELMQEKGFSALSIQDITARATVNRGTFYAHFPDKFALLEAVIREQFHQAVALKLPSLSRLGRTTLRLLIQTVFEYFREIYHRCPPSETMTPFLEQAIQEELTRLLVTWLKQERVREQVPVETMAVMVSWAILGAVVQWCRGTNTISAEQMANQALIVITGGMERMTPDAFGDS
ncbi:TetR family transcriptional regulator [Reticulibacter mediterranei]|uniref:TetR family transcriptional regulator n=1 Tax=Reticulibacter mediterranei TaxID=2778369 RepID=A0A8J3N6G0_9CHLR|nr:TetR/AcrR family transcriptional regulator [Reticulibacter mediterranei]GHP00343.1 TetR family transcriptional regulator [Reticulibacter mediterranei]